VREESLLQDSHHQGKKMIMIVKTPGCQVGSSAAVEEGDDDDCFYYHSWRNNVVIALGTLLS